MDNRDPRKLNDLLVTRALPEDHSLFGLQEAYQSPKAYNIVLLEVFVIDQTCWDGNYRELKFFKAVDGTVWSINNKVQNIDILAIISANRFGFMEFVDLNNNFYQRQSAFGGAKNAI